MMRKMLSSLGLLIRFMVLLLALCKIHAPAGGDQSKIPCSQQKIIFSMKFLVGNVLIVGV